MPIFKTIKSMYNAFTTSDQRRIENSYNIGPSVSVGSTPHRPRLMFYNDRSIISSIYTRIAVDVAGVNVRHIKLDDFDRYAKAMDSSLNECFTLEPNLDQAPRAFRQDLCMTLFDKGVAAVVPVDTIIDKNDPSSIEIVTLRVGDITAWYPKHVRVNLYNEETGVREEITLEKRRVAIIENPLYAVMNEPNGTLQRLIRKLSLLDAVDEQSGSGKLDLIIQLPYVIKSEARRQQAEKRREDIEFQLRGNKYGIAYTDGTEKITQLNRPVENNLFKQVEYLTKLLFDQLGVTVSVMDGTADEKTMINYFNRTIEPILDATTEEMQRKFLGRAGTNKKERIRYFRDPFKLVPLSEIAEIADKFARNEIFSSNEIRSFMGIPPSSDPKADELLNSNMPHPELDSVSGEPVSGEPVSGESDLLSLSIDDIDTIVNELIDRLDARQNEQTK